jgi:hypothetical protein
LTGKQLDSNFYVVIETDDESEGEEEAEADDYGDENSLVDVDELQRGSTVRMALRTLVELTPNNFLSPSI